MTSQTRQIPVCCYAVSTRALQLGSAWRPGRAGFYTGDIHNGPLLVLPRFGFLVFSGQGQTEESLVCPLELEIHQLSCREICRIDGSRHGCFPWRRSEFRRFSSIQIFCLTNSRCKRSVPG